MTLYSVSRFIKAKSLEQFPSRRPMSGFILAILLILLLIASLQVSGSLLLRPLEIRFPVWRQAPNDHIVGIILLGGFHLDARLARQGFDIRSGMSERVMETVRLSDLYPEAKILYSGGGTEAHSGKKILERLGVKSERIIIEDRSRSTAENARFSKIIAAPKRSERWLLVTSAFHMPRAMGAFRAVGFPVEADPVDFQRSQTEREKAVSALREYGALFAYRLSGQSNELFPSP
jgi:uncharacterized SAM-binding protein YcdF (DUF218 family)